MKISSCAVIYLLMSICSLAAQRVALVIGNDIYEKDKPLGEGYNLANAGRDASAVAGMLTGKLGFAEEKVILATNLNRVGIYEKLEEFGKLAEGSELALVYYAGHGMESLDGNANFLLPTDVDVQRVAASDAALKAGGVNLATVIATLKEKTPLGAKVVLMDCCRERPKGRNLAGSVGGGLIKYKSESIPLGTLVMLAASPGKLASDGLKHGPFTQALLEKLPLEGKSLLECFFEVSDRVEILSKGQQAPWLKTDGSARVFRQLHLRGFNPKAGVNDAGEEVLVEAMRLYQVGAKFPEDFLTRVNFRKLKSLAEKGSSQAQFLVAKIYHFDAGGLLNQPKEAAYWYRKSAEQGFPLGQLNLGLMYVNGWEVPKDDVEAVRWYRKAAEQGVGAAQYKLGRMYVEGQGVEKDEKEAANWVRKAAEQEMGLAQYGLGRMYAYGRGVEKDEEEAVNWYRKAAEQGVGSAQYNLGNMYEGGRGVEKDEKKAASWHRKAAEQGVASSQVALGVMCQSGEGVEKNEEEAARWFRMAAEQGSPAGASWLGIMCYSGKGVEKNEKEAEKWFRKAANQGHANGQYNLGVMYSKGEGDKQDLEEAERWIRKAAAQGFEEAKDALEQFKAQ